MDIEPVKSCQKFFLLRWSVRSFFNPYQSGPLPHLNWLGGAKIFYASLLFDNKFPT